MTLFYCQSCYGAHSGCVTILVNIFTTESSMPVECKNAPDEPSAAALPKMVDADEGKHRIPSLLLLF